METNIYKTHHGGQVGYTHNGASGYLWYIRSEHENRLDLEGFMQLALTKANEIADGFRQDIDAIVRIFKELGGSPAEITDGFEHCDYSDVMGRYKEIGGV